MKVTITVTGEDGRTFEGSMNLTPTIGAPKSKQKTKVKLEAKRTEATRPEKLSFDMNVRAFMKKYGNGRNGQAKFTVLIAHMAAGQLRTEVTYADIAKIWNKMKTLLGGELRGVYALRAKEAGWVDVPRQGAYVLTDSWRDALGH